MAKKTDTKKMAKTKSKRETKEKNQKPQTLKRSGLVYYPVGDFLIRVKNASLAKHKSISVRGSRIIKAVALALKKEGYLDEVTEDKNNLNVTIRYKHKEPVLLDIRLVSKPGLRVYMGIDEIEKLKGPSSFLVSTPQGVLSSKDAIKKRVGGEVIAEVL